MPEREGAPLAGGARVSSGEHRAQPSAYTANAPKATYARRMRIPARRCACGAWVTHERAPGVRDPLVVHRTYDVDTGVVHVCEPADVVAAARARLAAAEADAVAELRAARVRVAIDGRQLRAPSPSPDWGRSLSREPRGGW